MIAAVGSVAMDTFVVSGRGLLAVKAARPDVVFILAVNQENVVKNVVMVTTC